MYKIIGLALLIAGFALSAVAAVAPAPEISTDSAVGALALVAGAMLVWRGRRK